MRVGLQEELDIALLEGVDGSPQHAQHELALLLEIGLKGLKLRLKRDSQALDASRIAQ